MCLYCIGNVGITAVPGHAGMPSARWDLDPILTASCPHGSGDDARVLGASSVIYLAKVGEISHHRSHPSAAPAGHYGLLPSLFLDWLVLGRNISPGSCGLLDVLQQKERDPFREPCGAPEKALLAEQEWST